MKLVDKAALAAEIEKELNTTKKYSTEYVNGKKYALKKILSLINTLETKEVDLEEKANQLSQKYFPDKENIWARSNIEAHKCKSACIEMVEWVKAQKGE